MPGQDSILIEKNSGWLCAYPWDEMRPCSVSSPSCYSRRTRHGARLLESREYESKWMKEWINSHQTEKKKVRCFNTLQHYGHQRVSQRRASLKKSFLIPIWKMILHPKIETYWVNILKEKRKCTCFEERELKRSEASRWEHGGQTRGSNETPSVQTPHDRGWWGAKGGSQCAHTFARKQGM